MTRPISHCVMRFAMHNKNMDTTKTYTITKSGKLHASIKCVECGGKHEVANLVKIDLDGSPRHGLCKIDRDRLREQVA